MSLPSVLRLAQLLAEEHLSDGDLAIDATVGSGYDTVFLAEQVGERGRVYGFDVQQLAHERARKRLMEHGLEQQVELVDAGHELMGERLPADVTGRVRVCMFNLGYLPGSDKKVSTHPETTVRGLMAALELLAHGGIITAVLYTGHDGGEAETRAVLAWASTLPRDRAEVHRYHALNSAGDPPQLLVVARR